MVLGLSPAIVQSLGQLRDDARLWYVVVVWVLFGVAVARRSVAADARVARAVPWVLVAAVVQILAWGGGVPQFSRLALPFALMGFARGLLGTPLAVAAMAFLCIPPPHFLTFGPGLADLWARVAALAVPAADEIARVDWDGGLRFGALLAAIGWYGWARRRSRLSELALALAAAVPLAVAWQILTDAVAGALPGAAAEAWLVHGSWIVVAALGLWAVRALDSGFSEHPHAR